MAEKFEQRRLPGPSRESGGRYGGTAERSAQERRKACKSLLTFSNPHMQKAVMQTVTAFCLPKRIGFYGV